MSEHVYVAVTGMRHYYGSSMLRVGQVLRLIKEPDNQYDQEAIRAEITPIGKIGYVANSTHTVPKGCKSGGRVYDSFDDQVMGIVRFVVQETAIVEVMPALSEMYLVWEQERSSSEPLKQEGS
ncbi:HIRAN domain-containing protein [Paenibacillus koleovorans]|uniref:HIRAN domain-containing protein n=1 Tax=Paenibacillus koleovorans TaxID=121608 RepID=UPI000FD98CD3|nr:HIRAN domain-containing protein [Paenibacillus koleovorans]